MAAVSASRVVAKLRTLAELGRHQEVVVQARKALATWPDSASILAELGRALFNLDAFDDAIPVLERVGALWPNDAWSFRVRSRALRAVNRLTEAIAAAETAVQLAPLDFDCHLEVSNNAALQGDRGRVWSALERARVLAPNSAKVLVVMGKHAANEQRYEASLEYHRQALALSPDDAVWHCNVGDALGRLDRNDEAEVHFLRAISCDPKYSRAYEKLADLRFFAGKSDAAFAILKRCIEADPKKASAYSLLSMRLREDNRYAEALDVVMQGIAVLPKDPTLWVRAAECHVEMEDYVAAERCCRSALSWVPQFALGRRYLSVVLSWQMRHQESLQEAEAAVALDASRVASVVNVADALLYADQADRALAYIESAIERSPEVVDYWYNLSVMALAVGNVARMDEAVDQIVKYDGDVPSAWIMLLWLGWAAEDCEKLERARTALLAFPPQKTLLDKRHMGQSLQVASMALQLFSGEFDAAQATMSALLDDPLLSSINECMVVTAQAILTFRRGDHDEAARLANRGPVGPHNRRVCPRICCVNARLLQREMGLSVRPASFTSRA